MSTDIQRRPAADLSQEEYENRVERCYELEQQIKSGLLAGRVAWWATASALYAFHQEGGIKLLNGADCTVAEWCAQPDVAITKQRFDEYFHAWRMVEDSGLELEDVKDVPWGNLVRMFRAIRDGKLTFRKALDEARSLSQSDINEKYQRKPQPPRSVPTDAARSDDDSLNGKVAAGPDEGTGDEVGEPNLATTEAPPSGQDEEPRDTDVDTGSTIITGPYPGRIVTDVVSPSPAGEVEDEEVMEGGEESSEAPAPQASEPDSEPQDITELEYLARKVVEAYEANPAPTKNVPKAIRQAIVALSDYLA